MRSPSMASRASHVALSAFPLLLLVVIFPFATADVTVEETVQNSCTSNVDMQCKTTLGKDYGLRSLPPGDTFLMTVTSTLQDSDLTCTFVSTVLPDLKTAKAFKLWEYVKSGFIDFPEMACASGCFWKLQDDGLYYRKGGESFVLLVKWADILPGVVV